MIIFYLEIDQSKLLYQHGSKSCAFNTVNLITSDLAKASLLNDLNQPDHDLLTRSFHKHCEVLKFRNVNSGLSPFVILSANIWIDRISPTMHDATDQQSDDDADDELADFY